MKKLPISCECNLDNEQQVPTMTYDYTNPDHVMRFIGTVNKITYGVDTYPKSKEGETQVEQHIFLK